MKIWKKNNMLENGNHEMRRVIETFKFENKNPVI